eukprot:scaffold484379_cov15-Prasinocladus_malaysianus.AAC.1
MSHQPCDVSNAGTHRSPVPKPRSASDVDSAVASWSPGRKSALWTAGWHELEYYEAACGNMLSNNSQYKIAGDTSRATATRLAS